MGICSYIMDYYRKNPSKAITYSIILAGTLTLFGFLGYTSYRIKQGLEQIEARTEQTSKNLDSIERYLDYIEEHYNAGAIDQQ